MFQRPQLRCFVAAVLLVVLPMAAPAAASATQHGDVHRQIAKLSKQVRKLRKQVKALQAVPATPGPVGATGPTGPTGPATGPAGGALEGSYPDPTIAPDAVGSAEVLNDSLTVFDFLGADVDGTVSLAGIPDGRCTQVTLAVPDVQMGQVPIVTTRAAVQNGILMYANRVASAGTVEVNACNFSGGAMTALSGFPIHVTTFG